MAADAPEVHERPVAFVVGITGQTGSYLAELLLDRGYEVHGLVRRTTHDALAHVAHLLPRVTVHHGDVCDLVSLLGVLARLARAARLEIYNLAAQSHVKVSFDAPLVTAHTDALGALNVLEAVRQLDLRHARVLQASTSEMFGASPPPQSESTPFHPRSPYGAAKLFAYWTVRTYRDAHGLFACNAVSFNHESERRGEMFVTRKITRGVARLVTGADSAPIRLGNLDAKRDWGHAADVARAMWLVLQRDEADDYVVATGETRTVRQFADAAFAAARVPVRWEGAGVHEVAVRVDTGAAVVVIDPDMYRPAEVDELCGDAAKLRERTGWRPRVGFQELVQRMVDHDLDLERRRVAASFARPGGGPDGDGDGAGALLAARNF